MKTVLMLGAIIASVLLVVVALAIVRRSKQAELIEVERVLSAWGIDRKVSLVDCANRTHPIEIFPVYECTATSSDPFQDLCKGLDSVKGYQLKQSDHGCFANSGDISIEIAKGSKQGYLKINLMGSP